jgi:glyoxylase-like metal-dependent hydrolase (beta-lactamase superfamily II)
MMVDRVTLGQFEIYGLRDGFFHLDGGAMFGVVPKALWEKKYPADKKNRIRLGLNSILVNTQRKLVLVETGIGESSGQKFSEYYSVERKPGLVPSLQKLGYQVDDIDFVVNTHLHFDHCGGNTHKDKDGQFVPTFPKAKYVIQRGEWEYALHPSERDRQSYLEQCFLPLEKHGLLLLVHGDKEITEGVSVIQVPGHTAFHQGLEVCSEGRVLFFLGDLVPTSAHIGLSYIMSYDLFPLSTLENKKRVFEQAIREDWILAFNHDPQHFFGKVKEMNGKFAFEPLK